MRRCSSDSNFWEIFVVHNIASMGCSRGGVLIKLQSSLKPGTLHAADDDSFLYLAMPVRLA